MRVGNVVEWSDGLWIVASCSEGIVDKDYTKRATLIYFGADNMSAYLTDKEGTKFDISEVKVLASNVEDFVMRNLTKMVFSRQRRTQTNE